MALESDLIAELKALCPRVYIGTAPYGTATPYVTWQHIGGDPMRYADNTSADKRWPEIQINTWTDTPMQAFTLIQQIEDRLCEAAVFQAEPIGGPIGAYADADAISGYLQTFKILGNR